MYTVFRSFIKLIFSIYFNLKFEGKENIPKHGGVIYACNHRSYADPILLTLCVRKRFCYLAKEELFSSPVKAFFLRLLGAYPVVRGQGDMKVIDDSVERLKSGKNLAIFPEGTRSKDGKLGRGKSGVALIASKTHADVVPVAVVYGENEKLHFRSKVIVRYGKPIAASELEISDKPALRDISRLKNRIMGAIAELLEDNAE